MSQSGRLKAVIAANGAFPNYTGLTGHDDIADADLRWTVRFCRDHKRENERFLIGSVMSDPWPSDASFKMGEYVAKKGRASWRGKIVGWYRTEVTALGYAIESHYEPGSVQIYPETAVERWSVPID